MIRTLAGVLLTALLCGCITPPPPITYVQLTAGDAAPGTAPGPRVMIDAIDVPDFLLRNELLRRIDDNQLRYDRSVRWAEPMDIGVQRVVTQLLSAALDSFAVISFPSQGGRDLDWTVDISLLHFEAVGEELRLSANIRLVSAADGDTQVQRFDARRQLPESSGAAIAAGLSQLLRELVDDISTQISASGA